MRKQTVLTVGAVVAILIILLHFATILAEANTIHATVNVDPDSLLLKDEGYGKWITAYIKLPDEYDVRDINVTSVVLKVSSQDVPISRSDMQGNMLMVKFDRRIVVDLLRPMTAHMFPHVKQDLTLTIEGTLFEGSIFSGSDIISVFYV